MATVIVEWSNCYYKRECYLYNDITVKFTNDFDLKALMIT